ncbi:MAG: cytochrome c oxidase subunit 3 [Thermodesulfobacteriota bacterium]
MTAAPGTMHAPQPPPLPATWELPSKGRVGMAGLIVTESSFFAIFVVAYLFYVGKSLTGPYPADVLELPILSSICLLSSSVTIVLAVRALRAGSVRTFGAWWLATILLGLEFLIGTGIEWHGLIYEHGLTIGTNLFGTTFYSLVGFHALHVLVGLLLLTLVLLFTAFGKLHAGHAERAEILSWYWHFVDTVWIVVFTVVYVIGV